VTALQWRQLNADACKLMVEMKALARRITIVEIAIAKGGPRFCKRQYAKPDFDTETFDAWLASRGFLSPSTCPILADWAGK
jgi:hypothetical protein